MAERGRACGVAKFRKKPGVVEAIQFDGSEECIDAIRVFAKGAGFSILRSRNGDPKEPTLLEIPTREGRKYAQPGDWIVRGVTGEFLLMQRRAL